MNQIRPIISSILLLLVLLAPVSTFAVRHGGNRCTDRCADSYRL